MTTPPITREEREGIKEFKWPKRFFVFELAGTEIDSQKLADAYEAALKAEEDDCFTLSDAMALAGVGVDGDTPYEIARNIQTKIKALKAAEERIADLETTKILEMTDEQIITLIGGPEAIKESARRFNSALASARRIAAAEEENERLRKALLAAHAPATGG